jgi:ATP-binding cassette subfamily B protein
MEYCVGQSMAIDWGDDEAPPKWDRAHVVRILRYLRPYRAQCFAAIVCLIAGAALGLVPALITKAVLDYLTQPGGRFGHVVLLVTVGVAAAVVGGLIGVAQAFFATTVSQGIEFDLRKQLFDRLIVQSVGFFTKNRTGHVLSRITNDAGGIEDVITETILGMAWNVVVVPTTLALMFHLDWRLSLVALVGLPFAVIPSRRMGKRNYYATKKTQAQFARMTAYLQEVLGISGILLVKAFVKQRAERRRFQELNSELRRLGLRKAMIERLFYMLMELLHIAAPAALWLYGGYLVLRGQVTVGTVVTFIVVLMGRLYGSVSSLASLHVNVTGSLALFHRLFQVLDLPVEIADSCSARRLPRVQGAVAFENVTFAYGPDLRPALDQVSFKIEPGQLVAMVGPTGAGKSTVTYLLPRFYDPQQGRILVDGLDVRDVTLESLGSNIGTVFQDTFLFHTTLRDNLRYARPEASDEELVAAVKAAQLQELVLSLPEGYDTVVGERGHRLSGGEKQRVAIARAILKDPPILILDEATSHLDTVSEQLIQAALKPLFQGRSSLVVAHRLSTILAADRIVVLDQGRMVEEGTHAELLGLGGLYARLYERQFQPQVALLDVT